MSSFRLKSSRTGKTKNKDAQQAHRSSPQGALRQTSPPGSEERAPGPPAGAPHTQYLALRGVSAARSAALIAPLRSGGLSMGGGGCPAALRREPRWKSPGIESRDGGPAVAASSSQPQRPGNRHAAPADS